MAFPGGPQSSVSVAVPWGHHHSPRPPPLKCAILILLPFYSSALNFACRGWELCVTHLPSTTGFAALHRPASFTKQDSKLRDFTIIRRCLRDEGECSMQGRITWCDCIGQSHLTRCFPKMEICLAELYVMCEILLTRVSSRVFRHSCSQLSSVWSHNSKICNCCLSHLFT